MGAKPKLTTEEWNKVRITWENDSRKSLAWLKSELDLPVSNEAVRLKAKSEGWKKSKNTSLENEKPSLESQESKLADSVNDKQVTRDKKTKKTGTKSIKNSISITADKAEEPDKKGRPTKYKEEYARQAYKLCLIGYTDKDLAEFFDVSESTITVWKAKYEDFSASIKDGKAVTDANVAEKLYHRAIGYSHEETHVSNYQGQITLTPLIKHYPPETGAAFIWLKNRQPRFWREKVESSLEIKFDKETLEEIKQTFISRMEAARERQRAVLIERGILIEHSED